MKKNGFTLVEILIVTGSIVLIMASIGGVMFGVFKAISKNQSDNTINVRGNWIIGEIKKNILNANSKTENGVEFTCPIGISGDSITITNVKDGEKTTIACFDKGNEDYKIASISGKSVGTTVYLFQKNNDLSLKNCSTFVTCSTLPSLQLSTVNFNFILKAGVFGVSTGTTKSFSLDVTLRNQ